MKGSHPWDKTARLAEITASAGLALVCVAMLAPFLSPADVAFVENFKWVYSAGALIYTVARVAGARDPRGGVRLRRLRRMEFWAGMAFIAGGAFWFYTESHLGPYAGVLALLHNTILFTLVGAIIQVIASWLIVKESRKEAGTDK